MKLGVLTVLFQDKSFSETCKLLAGMGVQSLEIGCGGYPGRAHCDPRQLLSDAKALAAFQAAVADNGLQISALSAHGNPVHPDPSVAHAAHDDFVGALEMAEVLGVDTVVTFSGCPGGCAADRTPNWSIAPWPDDFQKIREYQWNEVLIPYWEKTAKLAAEHGVSKIALEMHPGFAVYNPETCLRLRRAVGPAIGANFDPSHLFWQGIDPAVAIRALAGAIYHFHAKDTKIDPTNTAANGVLDTKPFTDETNRSWLFRTVGYGHGQQVWRDILSALRLAGYDGVISIEHEDSLMSVPEGLRRAVEFLKESILFEGKTEAWWA